ncbi:hypothetical protein [Hartmannibacter diazotrophicus]|uniref:hypothetical protein n=1 Tax=Hartmannibacter diazotrophicus TaxID=1482074 RepID=UPI0012FDBF5B|nr:hypothetical protein [Hartmannibacter diazotrophicus]
MNTHLPRMIFVAGMHRSGTSALTRVLNLAGAALPEALLPGAAGNVVGHWEPADVVALNDEILASMGLGWTSATRLPARWFDSQEAEFFTQKAAEVLRRNLQPIQTAVIKDPRLCRLLPLWIEAARRAGWTPNVVLMVRNPLEFAASLKARDRFNTTRTLMIGLRYLLDAEYGSREVPRAFVTYDSLLGEWRSTLQRLGERLDLVWPHLTDKTAVEIDEFLSDGLRHHKLGSVTGDATSPLHTMTDAVFGAFKSAAETNDLDQDRLNEQAARLAAAEDLLGPLTAFWETEWEKANALAVKLSAQKHDISNELSVQSSRLAEKERTHAEAEQTISSLADELQGLKEALARANAETLALREQGAEQERARAAAELSLSSLSGELAQARTAKAEAEAESARLKDRIGAMAGQLAEREQVNRSLDASIEDYGALLQELEKRLGAVFRKTDSLEATIGTLKADNAALDTKLQSAEQAIESGKLQLAALCVTTRAKGLFPAGELFDEAAYRARNPDVDMAIKNQKCPSAFIHWVEWGIGEDRPGFFNPVSRQELIENAKQVRSNRVKIVI